MTKLNWRIVDRYFAGEATASERALVERWLADSPQFRKFVAELYRGEPSDDMVQRMQATVRARLESDIAKATKSGDRRRVPRQLVQVIQSRGLPILKVAAVFALLVGGSILARQGFNAVTQRQTDVALRTVTATVGQRKALSLPDGSKIVLGPGSTLQYAAAFGASLRREVRLQGEAYFDVRHDARRPFVVRAGKLVAEDLGTQFVVRAYPEDGYGRVAVREGLVGIAGAIVSPGEIGRLSANGEPVVESANVASWFAWTQGRLVFDSVALRDALPKLSRWYDLDLRLADTTLGDLVVVATMPEKSSDEAIEAMGLALGLQAVRDGRVITFRRKAT